MWDLIKTFIEGIWIERKYRYIFLFILLTLSYRCMKSNIIYTQEEIMPLKFVELQDNGKIVFTYLSKDFKLYPSKKYIIPDVNSKDECERNFYNDYFLIDINALIRSATEQTFIVRLESKMPFFVGEVYFYNENDDKIALFETLYDKGDVFNEFDRPIDYCKLYYERKEKKKKQNSKAKVIKQKNEQEEINE